MKLRSTKPRNTILRKLAPYSADVLDPFTAKCPFSFYQKLKAIIVTLTLLPIRLLIMTCLLLSAWVLGITTLRGLPEEEKTGKKPIAGWRKKLIKPIIEETGRLIFAVAGWHWISTKGKRASAKEAPILLITPHSSFWDTVVVIALRCPCMVIKDSTKTAPFFGDLLNYSQPVYVRRDDPNSRQHTVDEILRRSRSKDDWKQIIIFPEGTCGNRQALLDFKLGAFYPGVPIQPVFIRYPNKLDSITWTWNGPGTMRQLWLTLAQLHIYCELEFLPVYTPSKEEKKDARLFAANVRKRIAQACNIPMSYFSLEDVRYLNVATQIGLPKTAALVKLLRLRSKIGHEKMDVESELSVLSAKADAMDNTLCNLQGFATYLGADAFEAMKDFFYLLDQENSGKIDVRAYDVGLWLLRAELDEWQKLENGFKVFNSEGVINSSQFAAIALLWRGIPRNVASDIFYLLTLDSKQKGKISFNKFKSISTRFVQLERKDPRLKKSKKCSDIMKNGKNISLRS